MRVRESVQSVDKSRILNKPAAGTQDMERSGNVPT